MDSCTNELQQKLQSITLRRTPKPAEAVIKHDKPISGEFLGVKLKPTKPVSVQKDEQVNNHEKEENTLNNNHETRQRIPSIKDRTKLFENGSAGKPLVPVKPGVSKKPAIGTKPPAVGKKPLNASNSQNSEVKRQRPPSVVDKPSSKVDDSFKDTRVPELAPVPPQNVLGGPPEKPPKFGSLKASLKKYLGTSYPPRPVPNPAKSADTSSAAGSPVVEAPAVPKKPVQQVKKDHNKVATDSPDQSEDFYDDTACSVSNTADNSEDFYDDTACAPPSNVSDPEDFYDDTAAPPSRNSTGNSDDFYDDTACVNELVPSGAEEFGEDIYEPVVSQEKESRNIPAEKPPPTLPAKDHGKEDKKKEKERKKKEKEEKDREEKERKKREKEKEKETNAMRKRFSVRGNEKSLGTCCAAEDIQGDKMNITAFVGEEFDVIRKGKSLPSNKWLVRNKQGIYGFIDLNKIQKEAEEDEDLYEEVPAANSRRVQSVGESIPSPPIKSPPLPPTQHAPKPPQGGDQDIYDDVSGEQDAEELYELLPE